MEKPYIHLTINLILIGCILFLSIILLMMFHFFFAKDSSWNSFKENLVKYTAFQMLLKFLLYILGILLLILTLKGIDLIRL